MSLTDLKRLKRSNFFFQFYNAEKITQEMQNKVQYYTLLFITKVMPLAQVPEQIYFS